VSTSNVLAGKTLVDIDAGYAHTCAVDDMGQAYCWGADHDGQLGRPSSGTAYSPIEVAQGRLPDGVGFVDVTTGEDHSCAITDQGHAYCWGRNDAGQLGIGNKQDAERPTPVKPGDMGGRRLVAIDGGAAVTCAVDAKGRTYCWGENNRGNLGTGRGGNELLPAKVLGTGPNGLAMAEVSAGGTHICASTQNRRPYCWGSNTFHQVSPSDRGSFDKPHKIATGQVTEISAGTWYTCAVVEATDIYCWGRNATGQIGDGTKKLAKEPTKVKSPGDGLNGTEPERVQAMYATTCAMDAAGVAYCWGNSRGWGDSSQTLTPTPVPAEPTLVAGGQLTDLTDAGFSWCGMTDPSQPVCWSEGPFTEPTYGLRGEFSAIPTGGVLGGAPLTSLDSGVEFACVLDGAGHAYCWGDGALGVSMPAQSAVPVAVDTSGVLAGKTLVELNTGDEHACAVDDLGKAYCWGEDDIGELGNGKAPASRVPVAVRDTGALAGESLIDVEAGSYHTCALSDDGDVFCWGSILGDGSGESSTKPVAADLSQIPPGETVTSLHSAFDTVCAITDVGHAYCWGGSRSGQTGTGIVADRVQRPTPVVRNGVLTGAELTELVMPSTTTMCGLSTAGRIYCWGDDPNGILGNGDFNGKSSVPIAVIDDGALAGAVVTDLGASGDIVWAVVEQQSP
jgi:alpha-tubulin suppressor-like RCC1 family protein